jgi:hypothetical protein
MSFDCCLSHVYTSVSISSSSGKRLPASCEPLYATNTSHHKQEIFLYECPLHRVLLTTKDRTTELWSSVVHPQARWPFWLLKPASEHAHARLLPSLSWSWTVLVPSDTSVRAVLLPYVTYLLPVPHTVPYLWEYVTLGVGNLTEEKFRLLDEVVMSIVVPVACWEYNTNIL